MLLRYSLIHKLFHMNQYISRIHFPKCNWSKCVCILADIAKLPSVLVIFSFALSSSSKRRPLHALFSIKLHSCPSSLHSSGAEHLQTPFPKFPCQMIEGEIFLFPSLLFSSPPLLSPLSPSSSFFPFLFLSLSLIQKTSL